MTTNKEKAEAYVRQAMPELAGVDSGRPEGSGYVDYPQIQLQHWVDVMRPHFNFDRYYLRLDGRLMFKDNGVDFEKFRFNLTTGQPATEADYQAFCSIVSI